MKTVEKGEIKIVGMECKTTVQECQKVLPGLWSKFMKSRGKIKNTVNAKVDYGVCFDEGSCNLRYIACAEVSDFEDVPEGMVKEVIPASKYAVFTHKGDIMKIGETYCDIEKNQIPASGLKPKKIWLEVYDERFKEKSDDSEMDIYVSIE